MMEIKKASAPPDRCNIVAAIVFMLGLGTLLPWNFFITASQYFNQRLNQTTETTVKDYNYDNWMTLLSQLPLLLFTLLNSFFYQWVRESVRVASSLVFILLLFSLTATLVKVDMCPDTFFSVTMATIWFINMLQGSLFGMVGLLPARYSTLFMSGQGLAGIFAAIAMLLSKLGNADPKSAALGYFITPCVATLGTLACYMLLPHLEFARFHLRRHANEDEKLNELPPSADKYVVSTQHEKKLDAERILIGEMEERSSVLVVLKKIWVMAACITCIFAITLSVFPVVMLRVQTVYKNTNWDKVFTSVCCFVVFNVMDLVGRGAPSLAQWPPKHSRLFPCVVALRVVFIPLLMTCNIPNTKLTILFRHDAAFATIVALFAFSNGYLASLCMGYAPQMVAYRDCETAGSLMTFFLVLGLALGASLSFLLVKLL